MNKYDNLDEYQRFIKSLEDIEGRYGRHGGWQERLKAIDSGLHAKLEYQVNRTHALVREESPAGAVKSACAASVKGLGIAMARMEAAGVRPPSAAFLKVKSPAGITFHVYQDRAAIPETDGQGGTPCISAADLLGYLPEGVERLLNSFPGASVSKLLDAQAVAKPITSRPDPLGLGQDPLELEFDRGNGASHA